MNIYKIALFGLASLTLIQVTVQAAPTLHKTYALSQQVQGTQTKVCVYERKSHHVVWRHHFPQCGSVTWSQNQRAVVFIAHYREINAQTVSPYRVVVWRAGFGYHIFNFYTAEYDLPWSNGHDFMWSPDAQAVLWRIGGSGEYTEDEADLLCIDVPARNTYEVAENVRVAHWLSPKTVKYQRYFPLWMQPAPKGADHPHLWHRPSKGAA